MRSLVADLSGTAARLHSGAGHIGKQCLSAITGRTISEGELLDFGERIFNLQRAVLIRQGWGGRSGDNLMDYLFHEPIKWTFFNPQYWFLTRR